MDEILQKQSSTELPRQISDLMRERILSGKYEPGMRLGGVRQFAEEFSVSPVTFLRALDILESEKLIERIPAKGVYVSGRLKKIRQHLKACFAFPEKSIDFAKSNSEIYSMNSELYRGIMTGAANTGVDIQFSYFKDHVSASMLKQQLAILRQFDFLIFPSTQLAKLQQLVSQECIVFQRAQRTQELAENIISIDYNRRDARDRLFELYRNSGCRKAVVFSNRKRERVTEFIERVRSVGGTVPDNEAFYLEQKNPSYHKQMIREILIKNRPEFFFCDYTDLVSVVYEVALEEHLVIGKDIQITGIACGMTLMNLLPRYTFLQTPQFEFGKEIIERGAEAIRNGTKVVLPEFKVSLIKGQSVKNIPEDTK